MLGSDITMETKTIPLDVAHVESIALPNVFMCLHTNYNYHKA